MHALVFGKARMAARTLLARAGGVWMWPGIALTERRGAACVPIAADIARFWISRLHGSEANDWAVLRCHAIAAQKLTEGDEARAQRALDLPWAKGPRLWRATDIAAHLPLFKDYAPGLLAKAGAWDVQTSALAHGHQGGRFNQARAALTQSIAAQSGRAGRRQTHQAATDRRQRNPPKVPQEEPPKGVRYGIIKDVGRWALQTFQAGAEAVVEQVLTDLEIIAWVNRLRYDILLRTLLDAPKSLEELQRAVDEPAPGYEIHHIVEQKAADDDGFSPAQFNSRDNLVRIPTLKHREITGWFMTPTDSFNGLSPREYLRGKIWDERRRVGIDDAGVLKP